MADPQWIAPAITAISTILASSIAFYSAYRINIKNLNNDILKFEKQYKWEKEKSEISNMNERNVNKLMIYNKILRLDGELMILSPIPIEFNITIYEDKLRPIFFEKYHLLDQEIKDIVRKIDRINKICHMIEEVQNEHNEKLVNNYTKLINKIDNHYRRDEEKYE